MKLSDLKSKEFWLFFAKKNKKHIIIFFVVMLSFIAINFMVNPDDTPFELDRSKSLLGVDADHNGIRDDLDRYIVKHAKKNDWTVPQVKSMQQDARAMQSILAVEKWDKKSAEKIMKQIGEAANCKVKNFDVDFGKAEMNLEGRTMNTKARMLKYMEFARALSGSVIEDEKGDTCVP